MPPTSTRLFTAFLALCAALAFSTPEALAQSRTIVIDPGHGGIDRGGVPGQRISEKEMTLDVSRRLAKILEGSGYRVVMTRNSDVFIPLGTRVAIANSYRGATMVSVHFNSGAALGSQRNRDILLPGRQWRSRGEHSPARGQRRTHREPRDPPPRLLRHPARRRARRAGGARFSHQPI
jgi:hypothetical protein